jgi:hypothetical protein
MKTTSDFNQAPKRQSPDTFNRDEVLDDGLWQNVDCYSDTPCPACGDGLMYGADFPNGDGEGTCLNCGEIFQWDNEEGEWVSAD